MSPLLAQMRRSPAGDWTIADVQTVCRAHGARCSPPYEGYLGTPEGVPGQ